jgi:hypothetical protein
MHRTARPLNPVNPAHPARLAVATALLAAAGAAPALTLYDNFNPTAAAPVDYQTTAAADLSGSCAAASCPWINAYSAGFSFVAEASGLAARAYLPMLATYTVAGAERIYGLTITNDAGEIVARGGFLGRDAPIGTEQVYVFDLLASTHAGQPVPSGVLAPSAPELLAGERYHAHFSQSYGSMSGAQWFKSTETPASGQAYVQCQTNGGGYCAHWDWGLNGWNYPLGTSFTAPMTDFLPALAITDGNGWTPAQPVPEPASWALLALGLGTLLGRRLAAGR